MHALHDVVKARYVRYANGMSSCCALCCASHTTQNYALRLMHNLTPFSRCRISDLSPTPKSTALQSWRYSLVASRARHVYEISQRAKQPSPAQY
ncbi:hypothetical protein BV25DRAFT_20676 [Artomyces pyxidatus]|uniref:Uncharacterized protein n=1 Tax=Artomyces pyxidatus TaxID=48021 RepID=A0ACB8TJQ2_9AGAM|nr:hypothetical protein BV25DRAFT_20676 [Artomyces pyxidatus]